MKRYHTAVTASSAVAALLAAFLLAGCFADYGGLEVSPEVYQQFTAYQMNPDYRYYYTGRGRKPSVLIGLDQDYQLRSRYWHEISPADFEKRVDRVFPEGAQNVYGAYILTPEGDRAGVWYSFVNSTTIRFEGRDVYIISPEPTDKNGDHGLDRHGMW